jgi:DNA polymerase-3 subunit alpha
MRAPSFVHLRLHSEYSVSDGIVRIEEAVARARSDAMPALALTDAGNLFGMVKFYGAARAAGVKPIIGADCWLQNDADREKPFRLLLLCASRAGYLRLCDLLSRAWLRNQHRGRAEMPASGCRRPTASPFFRRGGRRSAALADHGELPRGSRRNGRAVPGRFTSSCSALPPDAEALVARSVAPRRAWGARGGDAPGAVPRGR